MKNENNIVTQLENLQSVDSDEVRYDMMHPYPPHYPYMPHSYEHVPYYYPYGPYHYPMNPGPGYFHPGYRPSGHDDQAEVLQGENGPGG